MPTREQMKALFLNRAEASRQEGKQAFQRELETKNFGQQAVDTTLGAAVGFAASGGSPVGALKGGLQSAVSEERGLKPLAESAAQGFEVFQSDQVAKANSLKEEADFDLKKRKLDLDVQSEVNRLDFENQKIAIEKKKLLQKETSDLRDFNAKRDLEAQEAVNDLKKAEAELTKLNLKSIEGKANGEDVLRKEFNKPLDRFQAVTASMDKISNGLALGTPQGDLVSIIAFVKLNDPTSIVKESEAEMVERAASLLNLSKGKLNKVLTGEKLLPAERARLQEAAEEVLKSENKSFSDQYGRYRKISKNRTLNFENITGGFKLPTGKKKLLKERTNFVEVNQGGQGGTYKGFKITN